MNRLLMMVSTGPIALLLLLSLGGGLTPALAEELDAASAEALKKTQELLKNPALRQQAIKADPNARSADAQAHALDASGVTGDAIYGLSSEIFEDLVKQANGDPIKMQEILLQAQKDPKGFAERMSEKNKRALRELSGKAVVAPNTPK